MELYEEITEYIIRAYDASAEHPWAKWPKFCTFRAKDSEKWFALLLFADRRKLGLGSQGDGSGGGPELCPLLNVKTDPDAAAFLTAEPGVLPAYHMSRRTWVSILLDGTAGEALLKSLIAQSFRIVNDTPTKRIYEAVKKIPRGKVASYGRVAELAGNPKMSRAVGNALHRNPDPEHIPCYRVVNAKGELAGAFAFGGENVQKELLEADGIEVRNGKVDLQKYGF